MLRWLLPQSESIPSVLAISWLSSRLDSPRPSENLHVPLKAAFPTLKEISPSRWDWNIEWVELSPLLLPASTFLCCDLPVYIQFFEVRFLKTVQRRFQKHGDICCCWCIREPTWMKRACDFELLIYYWYSSPLVRWRLNCAWIWSLFSAPSFSFFDRFYKCLRWAYTVYWSWRPRTYGAAI